MFVVRGVAWMLGLTSIMAISLSVLITGRDLDVNPDLGPQRIVVLPISAIAPPDATDEGREQGRRGDSAPSTGARTDPRRAEPVEPHDESAEKSADGRGGDTDDAGDRARDAADRERDAAEDAEGSEGVGE